MNKSLVKDTTKKRIENASKDLKDNKVSKKLNSKKDDANLKDNEVSKKLNSKKDENNLKDNEKKQIKPKVIDMVDHALRSLYHRKGCSLTTLKKHIAITFECDEKHIQRITPKIQKSIREKLENNELLQVSGTGLVGSFKLSKKPQIIKETSNKVEKIKKTKIKDVNPKKENNKVNSKIPKSKKVDENKEKLMKKKESSEKQIKQKEKKAMKLNMVDKDKNVKFNSIKKDVPVKKNNHKKSLGVVVARRSIHTPKQNKKRTSKRNDLKDSKQIEKKKTK